MNKHIGVLLSGRGSNFDALAESVASGRIPRADIPIVVSNQENAPGIEKARARGIDARVLPSKGLERETYDRQVVAALREKSVDLVCLAGYMPAVAVLRARVSAADSQYPPVAAACVPGT